MLRRSITVLTVLAAAGSSVLPAEAAPGVAPAAWHRYVLGPPAAQVTPVGAEGRGDVANAGNLVGGKGKPATLTTVAGRTPASVVLDFGQDIAGTPSIDVTAVQGAPTLTLVTGEARQFLRRPAVLVWVWRKDHAQLFCNPAFHMELDVEIYSIYRR